MENVIKVGDKVKIAGTLSMNNSSCPYAGFEGRVLEVSPDNTFTIDSGDSLLLLTLEKPLWIWINGQLVKIHKIGNKGILKKISIVWTISFVALFFLLLMVVHYINT